MGKIFYLMGKSSSGKDTIFKALLSDGELSLKQIVPYTTRPIREGEQNGVEYFFTDEAGVQAMQEQNRIIELRVYHTCHGDWKYFTAADDQINLEKADYLVIGTPEAFLKVRDYFGKEQVQPVYIELDDGVRLQRALDREKAQDQPKYEEMCRRYLADAADFAEDKLEELQLEVRFRNDDLGTCIEAIKTWIMEQKG